MVASSAAPASAQSTSPLATADHASQSAAAVWPSHGVKIRLGPWMFSIIETRHGAMFESILKAVSGLVAPIPREPSSAAENWPFSSSDLATIGTDSPTLEAAMPEPA